MKHSFHFNNHFRIFFYTKCEITTYESYKNILDGVNYCVYCFCYSFFYPFCVLGKLEGNVRRINNVLAVRRDALTVE